MATTPLHKPTVPRWLALVARCLSLTVLILIGRWVQSSLQGVSNVFSWHPLLMTIGFVIFMTEALLAYKAPIILVPLPRPYSKLLHWVCHSVAVACTGFGLLAVFRFHAINNITNLYSPHSYLGLLTASLLGTQFIVGFISYLWPRAQPRQRAALGPYHAFAGLAIWGLGLASIATGLQEKVAFIQGKHGLFSGAVRVPATTEIFVALLALTVIFIHAFHSAPGTAGSLPGGSSSGGTGAADAGLLEGVSSRDSSIEEGVPLNRG